MKLRNNIRSQKGFTLIEIIAVLVILGILAAIAIPKYLDMRTEAVRKGAAAATMELNARERLTLAQWKLRDGSGAYPVPDGQGTAGDGSTVSGPSTFLGPDWNNNASVCPSPTSATACPTMQFSGKTIAFMWTQASDPTNEPAYWSVSVQD